MANSPLPTATQQSMLLAAIAVTGLIALGTFWQATYDTLRYFRYRGLGLELAPETAVAGSEFAEDDAQQYDDGQVPVARNSAIRFILTSLQRAIR